MIELAMWLVTAAAIVGAWAINHKKRWGFYVWIVTNTLCVAYSLRKESPAQAAKYVVFAYLAAQGLWKWKRSNESEETECPKQ